jgi:hypothetical protein
MPMKFLKKGFTLRSCGCFAAFNLTAFLVYYIFSYIIPMTFEDITLAAEIYPLLSKLLTVALPIASGSLLYIYSTHCGNKAALVFGIFISITRIFYSVPFYYMQFIFTEYDSVESLLIGLAASIPDMAVWYGLSLLVLYIYRLALKGRSKEAAQDISDLRAFDFDEPTVFASVMVSLAGFVFLLVREIIDTVIFIIDYSGRYELRDIIYICVTYIFLLCVALLTHLISIFILKKADRTLQGSFKNS